MINPARTETADSDPLGIERATAARRSGGNTRITAGIGETDIIPMGVLQGI